MDLSLSLSLSLLSECSYISTVPSAVGSKGVDLLNLRAQK